MQIENEVYDRMIKDSLLEKPCIICCKGTHSRGIFVLNKPTHKGKLRRIIYALCDKHPRTQDSCDAIERIIEKMHGNDLYGEAVR